MNHRLLAGSAVLFCASAFGAVPSDAIWSTGFDTKAEVDAWTLTQTKEPSKENTKNWYFEANSGFDKLNPSSTGSLGLVVVDKDEQMNTTLVSPEIDGTGHAAMLLNFSIHDVDELYSYEFLRMWVDVIPDGSSNYTNVYTLVNGDRTSTGVDKWCTVQCQLPSECNNKKFKIQLRLQVMGYGGDGRHIYIDDMYVTKKPAVDLTVTGLTPTEVAGTSPVPVGITLYNNGSADLTDYTIAYMVNNTMPVVQEKKTDVIVPGESKTFTFATPADLSTMGATYTITGIATAAGDANMDDNKKEITATNIITTFPYNPPFATTSDKDFWKSGDWSLTTDRNNDNIVCWTTRLYRNSKTDAPLYSRPIYLEEGKSVGLNFSAWTNTYTGVVKAYIMDNCTDNYPADPIFVADANTTLTDFKANYTVPKTGVYYICLRGMDETGVTAMRNLYVSNVSLGDAIIHDLAAEAITAPASSAEEYSDAETVKFTYTNKGLQAASGMQAALIVDGQSKATEDLPAIAPGETKEYTFNTKVNLAGNNKGHKITVRVVYEADQVDKNNEVSTQVIASTFEPPYYVDTYSNDFVTHWSWEDKNNDGITFSVDKLYSNDQMNFNNDRVQMQNTDELLYSRPLKLRKGKTYRLEGTFVLSKNLADGQAWADIPADTYTVQLGLYKTVDGKKQLVKDLGESTIDLAQYANNYYYKVAADEDGLYSIGLHLLKSTPNDYYFRVNKFSLTESGDVDMAITSVILPGKAVSGNSDFMVKLWVANNGLTPISKFDVKVSAPSVPEITQTVELEEPIAVGSSRRILVDKVFKMNITKDETLTVKVVADGDAVSDNNETSLLVIAAKPFDVPATMEFSENDGWRAFDYNNDGKPEYYTYYEGFDFDSYAKGVSDEVMTPGFNLKKDKTYALKFEYIAYLHPKAEKAFDIYMVDADGKRTLAATITTDETSDKSYYNDANQAVLHVTAPADGVYNFVFQDFACPDGDYSSYSTCPSNQINNYFTIEEATDLPDLKLTGFKSHTEAGTYTVAETVKVGYKNAGKTTIEPATFELKAGDKTYHAVVFGGIAPEAEGEIEFKNVDLYTPGDYEMTVTTLMGTDATPADNTLTNTLKSNAVVEAAIVSIDGPRSGDLGRHEHIAVTIANNGKGDLKDFPVTYTLTREGGDTVVVTETVTDAIAESEQKQYTFAADADFSVEGTYTLVVKVELDGDTNADNNSASTKINSTHADMDAGVDKIVGPTQRLMTKEEYVVISVHNYGESDLFDVPVTATVSRGDEVVATINGQVSEIPAGESVEYTFPTAVDLELGGDYTIEAATTLESDVDKTNDSYSGTIYSFMIDCGVEAILSPTATTPAGEQLITVSIKNYGDAEISDVPVYFKLGNNPQAGKYEGTIKPGETAEYSFASKYNFREGRSYTLTAYTGLDKDMNSANDSCELAITPTSGIDGVSIDGVAVMGAKGTIIILSESPAEATVFSMAGATVAATTAEGKTLIPASTGVYLVTVTTAGQTATYKVIVK